MVSWRKVRIIFCVKTTLFNTKLTQAIYLRRDTLVPPAWGRKTFDELKMRGVKGDFVSLRNTMHELKKVEMLELEKWLQDILPPLENDLHNKL